MKAELPKTDNEEQVQEADQISQWYKTAKDAGKINQTTSMCSVIQRHNKFRSLCTRYALCTVQHLNGSFIIRSSNT